MKEDIQKLLFEEIKASNLKGVTKASQIEVFEPKTLEFGDWTSNICMKLAAKSDDNPREIAERLIENLTKEDWITKIEIAGAGFLNFYLSSEQKFSFIEQCLEQKEPVLIQGKVKQKILIEYVSSNPTGPILLVTEEELLWAQLYQIFYPEQEVKSNKSITLTTKAYK